MWATCKLSACGEQTGEEHHPLCQNQTCLENFRIEVASRMIIVHRLKAARNVLHLSRGTMSLTIIMIYYYDIHIILLKVDISSSETQAIAASRINIIQKECFD